MNDGYTINNELIAVVANRQLEHERLLNGAISELNKKLDQIAADLLIIKEQLMEKPNA